MSGSSPSLGTKAIIEFIGTLLPDGTAARLHIDERTYLSVVNKNRVIFDTVDILNKQARITLEIISGE